MKKPATNPAAAVSGIMYTQREGFADFEAPMPVFEPNTCNYNYKWNPVPREDGTPLEFRAWRTNHPEYPIVTHAYHHKEIWIWFPSQADHVAYVHTYVTPLSELRDIKRLIENIRHGQHDSGSTNCATCAFIRAEVQGTQQLIDEMKDADGDDADENALPPIVPPLGKHRP